MSARSNPRKALAAFIDANKIPKRQAAAALGVTHPALYGWLDGSRIPEQGAQREAIERWTSGAVRAEWWETADERKRREVLERVEAFRPAATGTDDA